MAVLAQTPQLLPIAMADLASMNDAEAVAESVDATRRLDWFVDASDRNVPSIHLTAAIDNASGLLRDYQHEPFFSAVLLLLQHST